MPTLYKLLGYTIYFWSGDGAEPVHVHVGKGRPNENDTKITDNVFYLGTHKGEFITHFTVTSKFCKKDLLNGISFIPKNQFEDLAYSYAILAKNPRTVILKKILYY